jgi:hypothetical protein
MLYLTFFGNGIQPGHFGSAHVVIKGRFLAIELPEFGNLFAKGSLDMRILGELVEREVEGSASRFMSGNHEGYDLKSSV